MNGKSLVRLVKKEGRRTPEIKVKVEPSTGPKQMVNNGSRMGQ